MDDGIAQHIAQLAAAYEQFGETAQRLAPARREEAGVCGCWSPHAVVAHLAGWDHALLTYIVDPENFDPPQDVHLFNAASVARLQDVLWNDLMQVLESGFSDLQESLATVTADQKIYPRVIGWTGGRRDDYALHTRQLVAWLP